MLANKPIMRKYPLRFVTPNICGYHTLILSKNRIIRSNLANNSKIITGKTPPDCHTQHLETPSDLSHPIFTNTPGIITSHPTFANIPRIITYNICTYPQNYHIRFFQTLPELSHPIFANNRRIIKSNICKQCQTHHIQYLQTMPELSHPIFVNNPRIITSNTCKQPQIFRTQYGQTGIITPNICRRKIITFKIY